MITIHPPDEIILRLTLWADQNDSVRAILLTSTRAQPQATTDIYSDYDIVLVVMDIHELYRDPSWLSDFGEVLVVYWDPICPESDYGIEQTGNELHRHRPYHRDWMPGTKCWWTRMG
jgi:hypothetical protein